MINDVLVLQRNIVVAANYAKIQPHGTELTWPAMRSAFENPALCTIDMVIVGDWDWHVEFSSRCEGGGERETISRSFSSTVTSFIVTRTGSDSRCDSSR